MKLRPFASVLIILSCFTSCVGRSGVPLNSTATPTSTFTASDISWLKTQAIPFDTSDPQKPLDDLNFLKTIVGTARIVALGEATHGTHEFFQMKHRMLEFLVNEMGFNTFAVEAAWPGTTIKINDYVHTGKGELTEILKGYPAEVLDLVQWIRVYNEDPSHPRKVSYYGFDIVDAGPMAQNNVTQYVQKVDPQAAKQVEDSYSCYPANSEACRTKLQVVYDWFAQHQSDYSAKSSPEEFSLALHSARVAIQYRDFTANNNNGLIRDPYMAENVTWILDQAGSDAKIVLWAHNAHVGMSADDSYQTMGNHLRQQYGSQMVVFGFLFYQGSFTALGGNGWVTFHVDAPPINSYESFFHEAGLPRFFLDLRTVKAGAAASDWLLIPHLFRQIGSGYHPNVIQSGFLTAALAKVFDVVVYFQDTSPSPRLR